MSGILSSKALTTIPLVCLAFFHKAAIQQTFLARANPMPGIQRLYFVASFQPAQFLAQGQGTAFDEFLMGQAIFLEFFFFKFPIIYRVHFSSLKKM